MTLLVDYNQVMLATLFASIGNHHNVEINENMVRHMFLNSIRATRKKFFDEYGEMVICADGKNSWRKDYFPYYKANRKKTREESELDWNSLFAIINKIREELDMFFPYKVIYFESVEADDIIGTICHEYGTELNMSNNNFLILSGDKDFVQLQSYANVSQYDPVRKKWIKNSSPDTYLKEHILKGDSGDGIPNILSEDNCLAVGVRQKPMTAKRLAAFTENFDNMDDEQKQRYERNKILIDLNHVPDKYKEMIIKKYNEEKNIGRKHLMNYFMQNKMKNLMTDIGDF